MANRLLYIMLLLVLSPSLSAQEKNSIKGQILDKKSGEAVVFAAVRLDESECWTATDSEGNFIFPAVELKNFSISIQCLGYEPYLKSFNYDEIKAKGITIHLVPSSFDMEEVTILAKNGNGITSSSNIGKTAIEHIQPTSLGDVMQLLPGNTAKNPDLSKPQQMAIREIGTDANSAFGTAILVDGMPVSNDANLQSLATSSSQTENFNTVKGGGVDLRQLSTDNIESVEVIKGIPSVAYGDLTSGAVVVNTKAGYTPWELKFKSDPLIKQLALGKGINFFNSNSSFNMDIDFLQSYSDVRSKYNGFDRFTGQLTYRKVFMKEKTPLSFNTKVAYFQTLDDKKTDPDAMTKEEMFQSQDKGIRLNVFGKWNVKKTLITNLKYTFSLAYTHQTSYEKRYRNVGAGTFISTSLTEGENEGLLLPTEKLTELTIDGKPLSFYAQVIGDRFFSFQSGITNKILYGVEFRLNGNNGDGQLYNITNPPFVSSNATRPRSYKDIPSLKHYSILLEDKLILPLGQTKLDVQVGTRINNFQAESLWKSEMGFYIEPRLNVQYEFLNQTNNSVFNHLSIRGGIGKTYKSPSLRHLYPDKAYFDLSVLNYFPPEPQNQMGVFYTRIFETTNPDLKPSQNLKKEIGIDFRLKTISGNITYFNEVLTNGFGFSSDYQFLNYYQYPVEDIPSGTRPDLEILPRNPFSYIMAYQMPLNESKTVKQGLEYSIFLGKARSIYTSFNIDGAWLRTQRVYSTIPVQYLPTSTTSEQYPYIGIYSGGESRVSERLNTNLWMTTQIPVIKLILSTTLQMIWYDKYYYPFYDEAPMYLLYGDGTEVPFTDEMRNDPEYFRFVNEKSDNYYQQEVMSPLLLTNFRLSKEIKDFAKLSFYANNFINHRPLYQYKRTRSYTRRNPSIYFGAEIKIFL